MNKLHEMNEIDKLYKNHQDEDPERTSLRPHKDVRQQLKNQGRSGPGFAGASAEPSGAGPPLPRGTGPQTGGAEGTPEWP